MFSPAPTYAPPPATYRPPTQPKPLIRAQAPDEPNPARPPQLTLPSPEQLDVAVRPAENATVADSLRESERTRGASAPPTADWTALRTRMKELGVLSFHMDSLPDGRTRFTCWMPAGRPGLTRRIESVAATEIEATQRALQEAAHVMVSDASAKRR